MRVCGTVFYKVVCGYSGGSGAYVGSQLLRLSMYKLVYALKPKIDVSQQSSEYPRKVSFLSLIKMLLDLENR